MQLLKGSYFLHGCCFKTFMTQYGSKVNWQSVAGLDSDLYSRWEQVIENQVEDRVSWDRKQKIYPWLLFFSIYVDIFVKTVLPIQWYSSKMGEFVMFATRICWGKTFEKHCFSFHQNLCQKRNGKICLAKQSLECNTGWLIKFFLLFR